jgi:hypothetical protein
MSSISRDPARGTLRPLPQQLEQERQEKEQVLPVDDPAEATLFSPDSHSHLTPYLAGLHAQCITRDLMTGSFLPPLANDKLLNYWKDRIAETKAGTRVIILLLKPAAPAAKVKGDDLVGVAMLATPHSETSPFVANVESLLVAAKYREKNGSVTLMNEIHGQAILKGRRLLVRVPQPSLPTMPVDDIADFEPKMAQTESGSIAEKVFKKLGYSEVGIVPDYSLNACGELKDVVFLYKRIDT